MPFLSVNGVELRVRLNSARRAAPTRFGGLERAFSGALLSSVRTHKNAWSFRTAPVTQAEAQALRGFLEGRGHHWLFSEANNSSNYYSDKGLNRSATSGAATVAGVVGGRPNSLTTRTNVSAYVEFAPLPSTTSPWTAIYFRYRWLTGTWHHIIKTSTGLYFVDGVAATEVAHSTNDSLLTVTSGTFRFESRQTKQALAAWAATTAYSLGTKIYAISASDSSYLRAYECTVAGTSGGAAPAWTGTVGSTFSDGTVTWKDDGRAALFIDDLVLVPFAIPSSWAAGIYTWHNANAWTSLPKLSASGDAIPNAPRTVMGEVGDANVIAAVNSGSWTSNLEELDFSLLEV